MKECSGCAKKRPSVNRNMFDGLCADCTYKALYNYEFAKKAKERNKKLKKKMKKIILSEYPVDAEQAKEISNYIEKYTKQKVINELQSWINFLVNNEHNISSEGMCMELEDRIQEIIGQTKIKI